MSANNSKTDINFIEEQIKALSPEDRAALLSRLAPSVVFCGSSVVSFGSAVQVNGSQDLNAFVQINGSQDLNAFIDKIPPEALGEFLKAIGAYIVNHKA
jgi:hypothetical protein